MRICILGDARSVHIQGLAPGLAAQGHEVHVVTHRLGDLPGVSVERFSVPPPGLINLRRWSSRRRAYLHEFLRRFDVVNLQFLADWGLGCQGGAAKLEDELSDSCLIASPWGSDIVDPPGESPATVELIEKRKGLLRCAAAVTSCGPSFAKIVADFAGLDPGSIQILPFGVDLRLFMPRDGRSGAPPVVGFYKGFRDVYGPFHLIRSIPEVLKLVPHTRFELLGDGPALRECQTLAEELGVSASISWIPRQPHAALPHFLQRWSVSAIPSVHEAFGVAALESSAMELPVVASDVCGLRDTVQAGATGLLVPRADPSALARAVVALLKNAALRERLGKAGRAMVSDRFDWRRIFPQWTKVFEKARDLRCAMV